MKSSWDLTKPRSNYHFSNEIIDPRYDTVIKLGRIGGEWKEEVREIIKNSTPATWATRGYKKAGAAIPSEDLATEEYDVDRVGADSKKPITNLNWEIPAVLQQISDLFALKDCMNRIHVQMPGQMWNMHLDKLEKWCPQDPDSVMRIMIHLTDWQQQGGDVTFVIGGADGLDAGFKKQADMLLRISSMTLPHGLVRVMLAEQLYRAWSITKNHPYHRATI